MSLTLMLLGLGVIGMLGMLFIASARYWIKFVHAA